ncbi:MoxR family ATPase [Methanofollis sp. W23]|uniref:AAA family ATPase n=1 Tax=Methanofollis sp. W23 TaxID=2817849 RepID=UPI0032AF9CCE
MQNNTIQTEEGTAQIQECRDALIQVKKEMQQVIVGQEETIRDLLTALVAGGNVLLEGVPGLAKTLTVRTLAACTACSFARIQFTPDLLPSDITGTTVYRQHDGVFSLVKGPVFHHIVLADEINRAPPKVQSALLEAMQERQVTIQGETCALPDPFFVLATQNPIESEGTYPLPEAQTDRFLFKLIMDYPGVEDEVEILDRFAARTEVAPACILGVPELKTIQATARAVRADPAVREYAARIVDATRHPDRYALESGEYIEWGASPRATLSLVLGAKARALLEGRAYIVPHDIKAVAHNALRHRILLTYTADACGIRSDAIIDEVLGVVEVP